MTLNEQRLTLNPVFTAIFWLTTSSSKPYTDGERYMGNARYQRYDYMNEAEQTMTDVNPSIYRYPRVENVFNIFLQAIRRRRKREYGKHTLLKMWLYE
jgi:hypothetical protein